MVVVEHLSSEATGDEFHVRYAQRLPLNTPYGVVVSAVKQLIDQLLKQTYRVYLGVDATSVGRPVVELMKNVGLKPVKITVTGGSTSSFDKNTGFWHVSKVELVSGGQLALGRNQLKIGDEIAHKQILLDELAAYSVKPNINTGNMVYEAHRERDHDDLTFSLLVCLWLAYREARRGGHKVVSPVEVEKGGIHTDPSRVSALGTANKGDRWSGLTGFRSG
jgi:hypothetical protein